jgi:aspartyl aminopeptidase
MSEPDHFAILEPPLAPTLTMSDKTTFNEKLLAFLAESPTPFHAVSSMATVLRDNGFKELMEQDSWELPPGKYFSTRNGSSIVAFIKGSESVADTGIRMVGAHTDSPCLKVKPNPEKRMKGYLNLGVEVYGGVLLNPWFDRDLSIAGRVTVETSAGQLVSRLVNFKRAIATVPSLAIHLDREANNNRAINTQRDIPPLLLKGTGDEKWVDILSNQFTAEHPDVDLKTIHGWELCFYDTQLPAMNGFNEEFIASARLDNLLSCYTGLQALLEADESLTSLLVCNDHEEVGSTSAEGAQGNLLNATIDRLIGSGETRHRVIARSLMISADNAHGIHPNYSDRHDPNHGPLLNEGPVIKINSNQRYASNSETSSYFSFLCTKNNVPCQSFVVRTDMACGSTIGPITASGVGIKTLDVGVPTFGMHSIRELAGSDDAHHLYTALAAFYQDPKILQD